MIPFQRYVSIVSGVGGGVGVRQRDLITRLFTANELVPPQSFVEFTSDQLGSIASLFGTTSEEYKRASFYFSFISKAVTAPRKIAFARWASAAVAPKIWGNTTAKALATYTAIANGSVKLTMGAVTNEVDAINLTGCASLAAVATALQTAIRAAGGAQFVNATVTFDATTQRFNLAGTVTQADAMAVLVPAVGTDLSPLLGWTAASGAVINNGSGVETLTQTLTASATASDNFGSYAFIPASLTAPQRLEVAQWNATQNNKFMALMHATDTVDAGVAYTQCGGLSGVAVTYHPATEPTSEYPSMMPGMILAATDYGQRDAAQNYMFQQFPSMSPTVTDGPTADALDAVRCNYYGRTQTGGQLIDFYQRGVLMGLATDATDMGTFANEMWLKDAIGAEVMSLLLSVSQVGANNQGRAQLLAQIKSVLVQALDNGVIEVGKSLNTTQQLYIQNRTGDPRAYLQVQNVGYWLDVQMQSLVTTDGRTEYKAVYTLLYSKADSIRSVQGSNTLI